MFVLLLSSLFGYNTTIAHMPYLLIPFLQTPEDEVIQLQISILDLFYQLVSRQDATINQFFYETDISQEILRAVSSNYTEKSNV